MNLRRAADGGRACERDHLAAAIPSPPSRPSSAPTSDRGGGGRGNRSSSGNSSSIPHIQESRNEEDGAPTTQRTSSSSNAGGRDRAGRATRSEGGAGQRGAPGPTPGVQAAGKGPARRVGTRRLPPGSHPVDDTDTGTTPVKTEAALLPSSHVVIGCRSLGEGGTTACRAGTGRNKRKTRPLPPAAQEKTDVGASGASSSSNNNKRGRKRARHGADEDEVVFLAAEVRQPGKGKMADRKQGTSVAIKPEH